MPRAAAAVWTVQGTLLVVAASGIVGATSLGWGTGDAPGPGMFPGIASVVLLVFTLGGLARHWRSTSRTPAPAPGDEDGAAGEGANLARLLAYAAALLLAAFTFEPLGYPLAAAAALLVMLVAGERVRLARALLITVIAVAATWGLFAALLDVPLPMLPAALRGLS